MNKQFSNVDPTKNTFLPLHHIYNTFSKQNQKTLSNVSKARIA